ncbi:MAG TPA: hypothetical protein VIO38_03655, partial [Rariglobus sp.]
MVKVDEITYILPRDAAQIASSSNASGRAGVAFATIVMPTVWLDRLAKRRLASRIGPVGNSAPVKSAPSVPKMDRILFMSEDHLRLDDHAVAIANRQHVKVGS